MEDKHIDSLKNTIDRVTGIIDDAINSNNYTDLSRQIGGLMRDATNTVTGAASAFAREVSEAAKQAAEGEPRQPKGAKGNPYEGARPQDKAKTVSQMMREDAMRRKEERKEREAYEAQYFVKPEDSTGGRVMRFLGAAGGALFGVLTITVGAITAASHGITGIFTAPLGIVTAVITAASFAMAYFAGKSVKKTEHFNTYRKILLKKLYADVDELSKETGVPEKEVVAELKEFTQKGMIKQGHFDEQETCFIASDELYEQYKVTAARAAEQRKQEEEARKKAEAESVTYSPEVLELLEKGNEYIQMIHDANEKIPGEEVTSKLNRMEAITRRIFEEVRKRPELAGSLNLFMSYYLPTTTKLVKAYEEMDSSPAAGDNIRSAKREIENSLDTISDAFENLLDSFFEEQAMDVSSDINVMKMMMEQDGLTEDAMTAAGRKAASSQAAAQAVSSGGTQASAQAVSSGGTQASAQAVSPGGTQASAQAVSSGEAQAAARK